VLKFAMNQTTTFRWSMQQDIPAYRQAGYRYIGLWHPKVQEASPELTRHLLAEHGMQVSSLSWLGGFIGSEAGFYEDAIFDAQEGIRLAGCLQAASVTVVSGARGLHTESNARRLLQDALTRLGDVAGEEGVELALCPMQKEEYGNYSFVNSLSDTLEVLAEIDHPAVKMVFPVHHLWKERDILERIPGIVPFVASLRVSDWQCDTTPGERQCQLGQGDIPLQEMINAFLNAGYQNPIEIEIWSRELWEQEDGYLQMICQAQEELLSRTPQSADSSS